MQSDLIGKIEKAKRYAQEPERIRLQELRATFRGGNDHTISLNGDAWNCDCSFFLHWQTCSHVMALQRMFAPMLSDEARTAGRSFHHETVADAVG